MIESFRLLERFGQFESVSAGGRLPLFSFTAIFGENGRGKSTVAAMLRSLESRDPSIITDRQRLGATQPPHLVLAVTGGTAIFDNGAWTGPTVPVAVFDDSFVAANVCSGIEIQAAHRQNLHELVLGAQGVSLKAAMDTHVHRNEQHNSDLRVKENAIPVAERGGLSVDEFYALPASPTVGEDIRNKEREVEAATFADSIRQQAAFVAIDLPAFDVGSINALLARSLPDLSQEAAAHVQAHFAALGPGGEAWLEQGIRRIRSVSPDPERKLCPFCAQEISDSTLIRDYQTYFDESYRALKAEVDTRSRALASDHGGDNRATFERAVRVAVETRESWIRYIRIPDFNIDTARVSDAWRAAREAVFTALRAKQAAPLDAMSVSPEATAAVDAYHAERQSVLEMSRQLLALNAEITRVKENARTADLATLRKELTLLKATQARHMPPTSIRCIEYLAEKAAKQATEEARDSARADLENYSQTIFPQYQTAINDYLNRFNADFRLDSVTPRGTRGGTVCSYSVLINNIPVDIMASTGPSFKTTLSAGDRNTLALAFFFASLDTDPRLAQMTVVIDDPITSLDEHRSLLTVQEIRRLGSRVAQLIILSHSKPFLCALWEYDTSATKTAQSILRDGNGSTLAAWDVTRDCITEHDRRHQMILAYIAGGAAVASTGRDTAIALRPTLEAFIRVAYPEVFQPGNMLGGFINICRQRIGAANQVLFQTDVDDLEQMVDYANRFHHDTNPNYISAAINDQELLRFCRRTITFTRRTVPPVSSTP